MRDLEGATVERGHQFEAVGWVCEWFLFGSTILPAEQTLAPTLELSGSGGIFSLPIKSSGYRCKKHAWFLPNPAQNEIAFRMSFVYRSMCRERAIQFIMAGAGQSAGMPF